MDLPDWTSGIAFSSDLLILNIAPLGNQLRPGVAVDVSLTQYSSLVIVANSVGNINLQLDFHQSSTVNGFADTLPFSEWLTCIDPGQTPEWIIPIAAGSVRVTNRGTSDVDVVGYGSNRQVPRPLMLGNTFNPRQFSLVGAVTAGTAVTLPSFDTGPTGTCFNGPIYVRGSTSTVTGIYGYQSIGRNNAIRSIYVGVLTTTGHTFTQCSHPLGVVRWIFRPDTTSATSNIAIDITQA